MHLLGMEYCTANEWTTQTRRDGNKDSLMKKRFLRNDCMEYMKSFFILEFHFDWEFYKQNRYLFPKLKTRSYNSHPLHYFWFVEYPFLYFIYTRLFCFLYKWIKLKGRIRKVIS